LVLKKFAENASVIKDLIESTEGEEVPLTAIISQDQFQLLVEILDQQEKEEDFNELVKDKTKKLVHFEERDKVGKLVRNGLTEAIEMADAVGYEKLLKRLIGEFIKIIKAYLERKEIKKAIELIEQITIKDIFYKIIKKAFKTDLFAL
jgi:hypothetical protein